MFGVYVASAVSGLPANCCAYSALSSLMPWTLPSKRPVARKLQQRRAP